MQMTKGVCTSAPFAELTGIYAEFVQKLARRDKTRKFILPVSNSARYAEPRDINTSRYVTGVSIYDTDSGAYLGRIWLEYNKWCVTNERISVAMKRKSIRKTEDMKKAIRLVDEFFYAQTIVEVMSEANITARNLSSDTLYTAERKLRDTSSLFIDPSVLAQFVLPRLEELMQLAAVHGAHRTRLASLAENLSAHETMANVNMSMRNMQYDMVVIRGDTYYVGSAAEQVRYTTDTLPAYTKLAVAKLKLSSDNIILEGAGIRVSSNTFAIFKETQ